MRYVQRDATGKLIGHFAHPNPHATEEVPDGHADVVAWDAERARARQAAEERSIRSRVTALEAQVEALQAAIGR